MATITKKKTSSGVKYKADIRIKEGGKIIHRESKTFSKKGFATEWADEREQELKRHGGLLRVKHASLTVGHVVQKYLDTFTPEGGFGRSKTFDINKLMSYPLAKKSVLNLTVQDLINHAKWRKKNGTGPATINNDYVWLSGIFKTIRASEGIPIDLSLIPDAKNLLRQHKMISKSDERDRRPTNEELWKLSRYFWRKQYRDERTDLPMLDLMWFQIFSSRRISETCRIEWADNNDDRLTGMVRDAKHPRRKEGNHKRFKFTVKAWRIAQRQPRVDERIFPYNERSVSSSFTKACKRLGIDDLHLHDLRHEATSRLFESGYSIEQVCLISLHEDWKTLKRYTNLKPEDLN